MGVRKSIDESYVVAGSRADWLKRCVTALTSQGFKRVKVDAGLGVVTGDYKQIVGTIWGDIRVAISDVGPNSRLDVRATANVDNIYALAKSPNRKIIEKFQAGIGHLPAPVEVAQAPVAGPGIADEIERLRQMHEAGTLTADEFAAAKAKLLS